MRTITLLSDFGTADGYVGALKGVIESVCPQTKILDLAHDLPAGDVVHAAFALASAVATFPRETIHVAVVDPGVGTKRRALLVDCPAGWFVGPDNGLLWLAARAPRTVRVLDKPEFFRDEVSATFHGRDIFASVAAHLAAGVAADALGSRCEDLQSLEIPRPRRHGAQVEGTVLYCDRFGNMVSNLRAEDLPHDRRGLRIEIGSASIDGLCATYGEKSAGSLLALFGSHGFLEVAVSGGSARDFLSSGPGAAVRVR